MLRVNEIFFIILLIVMLILNLYDVYADYQEPDILLWHWLLEIGIVLTSFGGLVYLLHAIMRRNTEITRLHSQLSSVRQDLNTVNIKLRQVGQQYAQVIQEQMALWEFTPSEKEVALLLLKGLSFEEIATIRETKEKTVRQQATAIYRKAGLNGRHEFAAWFFEDFLV